MRRRAVAVATRPDASVRVGVDVVAVDDVARSIEAHGDRYLRRVYTDREIEEAAGATTSVVAARLAARFAAKEAVLKVLRVHADVPPWQDIELQRQADGSCRLGLAGTALDLASGSGLERWSVSVSHEAGVAVAVVVAQASHGEGEDDK